MVLASVIVPTRNRAPVLRRCLQALTRQTLAPERFEVLVVDNGSSDDTAAVARSFEAGLQLRLLHAPEPGLHVGRHAGWKAARSGILMFCDDDTEALPGWVEAVVQRFQEPSVMLVGGNNHPAWEGAPPAWLDRWWRRPAAHGRALGPLSILDFGSGAFDIDPAWVWGCNFNVRSAVLTQSRGFHPDGVPRDRLQWRGDGETHVSNVVRAGGGRTVFDGAASVNHLVDGPRMTAAYFEQRAFAQGVSDSFAQIRRCGHPDPVASARLRGLAAVGRRWLGRLRDHRLTGWHPSDQAGREWRRVLQAVRRGHAQGWAFHQQAVRDDAALLAWVLKEDYL